MKTSMYPVFIVTIGGFGARVTGQSFQGKSGEAVWRLDGLTASYLHFYFPSNPRATARLLGAASA